MKGDTVLNPGDIVRIELAGGKRSFARVLHGPLLAFYGINCDDDPSLDEITSAPVLFKIPVMNHAVEGGRWPVIGSKQLEKELQQPVAMFKQDAIDKSLSLYIELPGGKYEERPAVHEECKGLERAAVWNPEHVEDRLRDYFAGVPNKWVESLQIK